ATAPTTRPRAPRCHPLNSWAATSSSRCSTTTWATDSWPTTRGSSTPRCTPPTTRTVSRCGRTHVSTSRSSPPISPTTRRGRSWPATRNDSSVSDPIPHVVPEPEVKAMLRVLGVTVPNSVVGTSVPDAAALRAPLVLKAFGPGIVHKTDVGAVRLGLDHADLQCAADDMRARLAEQHVTPAGFLVEEQA